jgi:signal transduction histidine kinase
VDVTVRQRAGELVVSVVDDGRGGVDPALGTGLRGLRQRVGSVDGTLQVTSPAGGPTSIEAVLPCAS